MLTMLVASRGMKYPFERSGLTVLAHEHDSPTTLNPSHRVVTKTHGVEHRRVELHECHSTPDMWLVAPMSKTHVPASRSFSLSRWAYTFSSLSSISTLEELASTVDPGVELAFGHATAVAMRRSDPSSSCATCASSFLDFERNLHAQCPILLHRRHSSLVGLFDDSPDEESPRPRPRSRLFLRASHSSLMSYNFLSCYNDVDAFSNATFNRPILIVIMICLK
jgi:hypothetical protein